MNFSFVKLVTFPFRATGPGKGHLRLAKPSELLEFRTILSMPLLGRKIEISVGIVIPSIPPINMGRGSLYAELTSSNDT